MAESFGGAALAEKWLQATRWQNLSDWRGLTFTPLTSSPWALVPTKRVGGEKKELFLVSGSSWVLRRHNKWDYKWKRGVWRRRRARKIVKNGEEFWRPLHHVWNVFGFVIKKDIFPPHRIEKESICSVKQTVLQVPNKHVYLTQWITHKLSCCLLLISSRQLYILDVWVS